MKYHVIKCASETFFISVPALQVKIVPSARCTLDFLIVIVGCGVQLGLLGTTATNRPIAPAPGDYVDGEIGGIIGRGNEVLGEIKSCYFALNKTYILTFL
jgi:hypothetical protein